MALANSYKKKRISSVLLCVLLFSALTIPSACADELIPTDMPIPIGGAPTDKIYTKCLVHLAWLTAFSVVLYLRCKRPSADEPVLPPDASTLRRLRHWVASLLGQREKGICFIMEKDGTIRCVPEIPALGVGRVEVFAKRVGAVFGFTDDLDKICDNLLAVQAVCYGGSDQEGSVINPPTKDTTPDASSSEAKPDTTVEAVTEADAEVESDIKPDTVEGDTGDKPVDTDTTVTVVTEGDNGGEPTDTTTVEAT